MSAAADDRNVLNRIRGTRTSLTDHAAKTITLATEDPDVFFHELAHAIHRSFDPKTGHGQESEAETIAQIVLATLARLYGRPA